MRAFGLATPILATMVREPTAWRLSVIAHGVERGRHGGADALLRSGCLGDAARCGDDRTLALIHGPTQPRQLAARRDDVVADASKTLEAAVFGLTERFEASACLFRFQFGRPVPAADCDCRTAPPPPAAPAGWAARAGGKNASRAALDALAALGAGVDAAFHAKAARLFAARARVAEAHTGVRLLCDD